MKKNKKKIILIICGILLVILLSGITYAWFKWRSTDNATVRLVIDNSSGLTVTFNGGQSISGQLEPTRYC